jgi:hypothetical protein
MRLFLAALLVLALPGTVAGGAVSSGGPWTYSNQYTTCKFAGTHSASANKAYARTDNSNAGCRHLAVRLKSNPGPQDSGWFWSDTLGFQDYPPHLTIQDNRNGSTAVASQHKGMESWWNSWSPTQQPHAW